MNLKLPALRWYYGWNVIVMALLFQSLCIGMSFYCFPLWVVPLSEAFDVARSQIMFAIAASQVVSGLISPFGGRALDRLPPHWVIAGGAIAFVLGLVLVACASAIWQVMLGFLLFMPIGIVLTGVMAAQTLATRWFTRDRGFAIACATLGTSFGGFTMPPIAATLMHSFGWRYAILAFAAATLLLIVISWRVLGKSPPHAEADTTSAEDAANAAPPTPLWRTTELLRDTKFQTIVLTFFPLLFAFSAMQMNLAAYTLDIGLTARDAAFMVAQLSLFSMIGRLIFGKLVDRYDQRLLYRLITVGVMIAIAIIISAAACGGDMRRYVLQAGIILLGLISSGYVPLNSVVIASKFGTRAFGQVTGLSNTFLGFSAAGSFIAASLRDASGSYPFAFSMLLLLLLPGLWQIRKLR